MGFRVYVIVEIISICLLMWFGYGLVRIAGLEEEPVVSDTLNFTNAATGPQNSFLTVDVAQNDKLVKFQVTQGNPTATLCPEDDSDNTDCATTVTDPLVLNGIDTTDSTVWQVQPGSYTLNILDNQNEVVSYNLFVIHKAGANTILRLALSSLVCGAVSIGCGWMILKEKRKRRLQGL
ncbi:MAG: hypothetical protein ACREBB_04115 [Nitrosotalea sp.]